MKIKILISSFLLLTILSSLKAEAQEKELISHKGITKTIVKSLSTEIDTRTKKNNLIKNESSSWRFSMLQDMRADQSNNMKARADFQIPLIWYYERF